MSRRRGLPSSLAEYVLVWCEDLLQDLPTTARTDLARTLSTMYGGGPWPTRLRIERLAEQISGNYGDANTFVGDLHSERSGYVATITQKLSEPDPQTRDEALELLARLPDSLELVRALDRAVKQGRLFRVEREDVLRRALGNPVLPAPVPTPEAYPELPRTIRSHTRIRSDWKAGPCFEPQLLHPPAEGVASFITLVVSIGGGFPLGTQGVFAFAGIVTVMLIIVVYVSGNVSVWKLYRKTYPSEYSTLKHLIIPIASSLLLLYVGYKTLFPLPTGTNAWAPIVALSWLVIGGIIVTVLSARGQLSTVERAGDATTGSTATLDDSASDKGKPITRR